MLEKLNVLLNFLYKIGSSCLWLLCSITVWIYDNDAKLYNQFLNLLFLQVCKAKKRQLQFHLPVPIVINKWGLPVLVWILAFIAPIVLNFNLSFTWYVVFFNAVLNRQSGAVGWTNWRAGIKACVSYRGVDFKIVMALI